MNLKEQVIVRISILIIFNIFLTHANNSTTTLSPNTTLTPIIVNTTTTTTTSVNNPMLTNTKNLNVNTAIGIGAVVGAIMLGWAIIVLWYKYLNKICCGGKYADSYENDPDCCCFDCCGCCDLSGNDSYYITNGVSYESHLERYKLHKKIDDGNADFKKYLEDIKQTDIKPDVIIQIQELPSTNIILE